MNIDDLDWSDSAKGSKTALHILEDQRIFLAMHDQAGQYFLHLYKKGGADPTESSQSWLRVDKLTAQCVLYEVFG